MKFKMRLWRAKLLSLDWIAIMLGKSQSGKKIKSLWMSKCFQTMAPQLALHSLRWLTVALVEGVLTYVFEY